MIDQKSQLSALSTSPAFRRLSLWLLVLCYGSVSRAQDYTCNDQADSCPTKENGICESSFGSTPSNDPSCRNGDCLDCNYLCQQFNYDCNKCLTTIGCYWCPGDGTCNNSPNYLFSLESSCTAAEDYIAAPNPGRCSSTELLFR